MLNIERVSKRYLPPPPLMRPFIRVAAKNPVEAVRDVSFQVGRGEVVGLVGPNGAGKTTLIRMIGTLLHPTAGRITVDGFDVVHDDRYVRGRLGLVLEGDRGLYTRLTGLDNLEFFAVQNGLSRVAGRRRARELLEMFDLARRDKLVFGYSAGMKIRLSLARSLLSNPPLLVLDEPTRSLDPVSSIEFGRMVRRLAGEQGHAVLLSDHRLDEVVAACDRIVVLVEGRVIHDGATDQLEVREGETSAAALRQLMALHLGNGG